MSHLSRAAVLACEAIIVVNFIITSVKSYHNHLSRTAVLACQAIRATWAVVAPVPSTKEIWRLVENDFGTEITKVLWFFLLLNVKEISMKLWFSFLLQQGTLTSDVAQCVRHHVTLARHRVWPLPENNRRLWLKIIFELNLPQVGKMKRKFGPRPSQEVRLNPGQSRSERQPWKVDFVHWFELEFDTILTLKRCY